MAVYAQPSLGLSTSSKQMQTSLYGVSIGENAAYALANLGLRPPRWQAAPKGQPQPVVEYREALADYGNAVLNLWLTTRVEAIAVTAYDGHEPNIVDPYGLRINDSRARLVQKRGRPDRITGGKYVYGPASSIHWAYTIHSERITEIAVSNGTF
jgi:hypothetical protein